ncbi:unnamed protein product [Enterobius vermicularis]|uniref:Ribosomal RNA processing protein 1 homolog n=1 Tax=Enterobius vermicularis TaxID=51028 RepID=A0A0N4V3Z0_ENTVE|nr:unnamed protein product [Enterobius vermicularis]
MWELTEEEAVLAQKLASGEPTIRKRALRLMDKWVKEASTSHKFNEESMEALCKGLYYGMWMQDKMIVQEELADFFGSLINHFEKELDSVLYIKSFFVVISDEWSRMDRWRMDKFLMLVRRLVRALFGRLKKQQWPVLSCQLYLEMFKTTVISEGTACPDGLKFHFASVYLDELDNAGGLSVEQVNDFLLPYAELLTKKLITDYLFDSVLDEIFISILHVFKEEFLKRQAKGEHNSDVMETEEVGLKFDYGAIVKMLRKVAKNREINSSRRRRFKLAAAGKYPFEVPVVSSRKAARERMKEEFDKALSRLLKNQKKIKGSKATKKTGKLSKK